MTTDEYIHDVKSIAVSSIDFVYKKNSIEQPAKVIKIIITFENDDTTTLNLFSDIYENLIIKQNEVIK